MEREHLDDGNGDTDSENDLVEEEETDIFYKDAGDDKEEK